MTITDHPVTDDTTRGSGSGNGTPQPAHLAQVVPLVARREVLARVRDRAFLISTAVLLAIIAAAISIPIIVAGNRGRGTVTVAAVGAEAASLVSQAGAIGDRAYATRNAAHAVDTGVPQTRLTVHEVADEAAALAQVRDGVADLAVSVSGAGSPAVTAVLTATRSVDGDAANLLTRAVQQARLAARLTGTAVTPTQVAADLSGAAPTQRLLDVNAAQHDAALGIGLAYALLFFFTVFTFGMSIAQSVVEEKQSRIVELLVTAIPVRGLLMGKILGNVLLALGQTVLLVAVGVAAAAAAGQGDVTALLLRSGGWFLLFFVLGFVMLSALWAAAGALAGRQEDLQSTTVPLQMLVMIPFTVSAYITNPGTTLTVMSYVPISAPFVMPRRILMGDVSWWEPVLSAGLVLGTAAFAIALGTRLYEGGVLRTGSRLRWREAWHPSR